MKRRSACDKLTIPANNRLIYMQTVQPWLRRGAGVWRPGLPERLLRGRVLRGRQGQVPSVGRSHFMSRVTCHVCRVCRCDTSWAGSSRWGTTPSPTRCRWWTPTGTPAAWSRSAHSTIIILCDIMRAFLISRNSSWRLLSCPPRLIKLRPNERSLFC